MTEEKLEKAKNLREKIRVLKRDKDNLDKLKGIDVEINIGMNGTNINPTRISKEKSKILLVLAYTFICEELAEVEKQFKEL